MGRVVDLAQRMLEQAQQYEQLFESHHLEVPAFDVASFPGPDLSATPAVAAQVETLRNELVNASLDLQELVRGPMALVMHNGLNVRRPLPRTDPSAADPSAARPSRRHPSHLPLRHCAACSGLGGHSL